MLLNALDVFTPTGARQQFRRVLVGRQRQHIELATGAGAELLPGRQPLGIAFGRQINLEQGGQTGIAFKQVQPPAIGDIQWVVVAY
ncbi:hypothetical protein D3C87_1552550 [compost metagenome]